MESKSISPSVSSPRLEIHSQIFTPPPANNHPLSKTSTPSRHQRTGASPSPISTSIASPPTLSSTPPFLDTEKSSSSSWSTPWSPSSRRRPSRPSKRSGRPGELAKESTLTELPGEAWGEIIESSGMIYLGEDKCVRKELVRERRSFKFSIMTGSCLSVFLSPSCFLVSFFLSRKIGISQKMGTGLFLL